MIIQPGAEHPSVANMTELVRTNAVRRIDIELQDSTGSVIDIETGVDAAGDPKGELEVEVTDVGGNVIYSEAYNPPLADPDQRRLKNLTTGKYYLRFGSEDGETDTAQTLLFNWHSRQNATSEDAYRTQVVEVVTPRTLSLLPALRLLIDKTVKPNLPEKYCFIGYTDGMLALFLKLGLAYINTFQPYPMWHNIDYFPIELHSDILLRAALYQGITSQLLFSIDTDVPNFSDSGHSFVLQHATPLAGYIQQLRAELEERVPNFKRHFINSGTIGVEVRMDMAFSMMLASAPPGSLFRNLWSSS